MFSINTNSLPATIHNLFKNEHAPQTRYNTRNRNIPNVRKHKSKQYNNSFMTKAYSNWAKLSTEIKNSKNLSEFKLRYKKSLVRKY